MSAVSQRAFNPAASSELLATRLCESRRKRFLCATDLLPRSAKAVQRAVTLSQQCGADLLVLHVVDGNQPDRLIAQKVNRARTVLLKQIGSLPQVADHMADAESRIEVIVGKPRQTIGAVATELDADLIILAAPMPRRFDALTGTTAERIARRTDLPVLIVNESDVVPYRNVAIATNLSRASLQMTHAAAWFGLLKNANASLIHAFGSPYQGMLASAGVPQDELIEYSRRWRLRLTREIAAQLQEVDIKPADMHIVDERPRPAKAVERAVRRIAPQLLIMGTSRFFMLKRMFVGSVADELLRNIECDILVISPAAARRTGDQRSWCRPSATPAASAAVKSR